MSFFNNDFEKQWKVLFEDVNKLNEYTLTNPVVLRNVKIENYDIEGAIFSGATFQCIEWIDVDVSRATLTKVVFEKCKFVGGKWGQGVLADVVFKDCEFVDTSLSESRMTDVKFDDCKLTRTGVGYLKGGKVEFDGCTWDMGAGGDSSCKFVFRKSSLSGISFSMMKKGVPISFEDCLLDEIDFFKSHFSEVMLRRVKQGEGAVNFNKAVTSTIVLEDVEMNALGLIGTTAESLRVGNSQLSALGVKGGGIKRVYIRDSSVGYLNVSESTMPHIEVANTHLYEPHLYEGFIGYFSVTNSTIVNAEAFDFKADTVVWDNVTLDGKIDLTNAQVKDFRPTRLKRGPQLQLVTTGSNLRFN